MLMKWHDASPARPASILAATVLILLLCLSPVVSAGRNGVPGAPHIAALRQETAELFYHGFENYMKHAFPEDELRPISCKPLTRDRENEAHFEVNDVLGNYSLTLIDTLSTLAILASTPPSAKRNKPLLLFQNGIKDIVELYGDGTSGPDGEGKRAKGFDLDSKVQVFETVIRGLGGLLSAHLFAVGDLPIEGYNPPAQEVLAAKSWDQTGIKRTSAGIKWRNGLIYNGQLLRLAHDLGNRLVPAFWTSTGIPYPRVNLRSGIPFYSRSPGNFAPEGQCYIEKKESSEVTETCSAGAGSLVLEFTVLSRLTGESKFEELAKRAFWAIWSRRSQIDLIGAGIDAETGVWQHSWTGVGASVDSFFEYALKSHVLLSGQPVILSNQTTDIQDPRSLFAPLSEVEHSSSAFLEVWDAAHSAIKRHVYRGANFQHPHYIQVDLTTGAPRAFWVDALSAYYPGLLAMAGHAEEATQAHLMHTAMWSRFSALPERYNMASGNIEGGLGWWVGRPELIESTWYLYRATEDPFYIYVGEMFLRDIKRRCWTRCGWAGIQNVVTGEKIDRMESFFLGETAKYLFLLFDPDHPLNQLDAPFVFSTEGHPLILPPKPHDTKAQANQEEFVNDRACPAPAPALPLTISNVAARGDVWHAGSLARLHLMPKRGQVESVLTEYATDHPSITLADVQSPSNWTHYPWTLPLELIPQNALSSRMPHAPTFELSFPALQNQGTSSAPLQRVKDGIVISTLGGLRLSMVQDVPMFVNNDLTSGYRVHSINNVALGKDEKVYLNQITAYKGLNTHDPLFSRVRDTSMLDLVVDLGHVSVQQTLAVNETLEQEIAIQIPDLDSINDGAMKAAWNSILTQISDLVRDAQGLMIPVGHASGIRLPEVNGGRILMPAITPTGIGAAPLPDWTEASSVQTDQGKGESLAWTKVFDAGELCDGKIDTAVLRSSQVIIVKRGNCSFSQKLSNIPPVRPSKSFFQLVVMVDYETIDHSGSGRDDFLTRPLLDEPQTTSSGLPRQHLVPMVMVGGGENTYQALLHAKGIGIKRRYSVTTQGVPIVNLHIV